MEKEARREEKEAMSTEDVEEILLEVKDKPIEPAEEVRRPDEEEPEIVQQEGLPEIRQPEEPMATMNASILEILQSLSKKMDETSQSTKGLSKQIESLKEGQKSSKEENQSTREELIKKLDETSRSTNLKIEEGQRESQKNMDLLKEEFNNQINETNRLSLIHI